MRVRGTASSSLHPEIVSISFAVETLEQTAKDALDKNSDIVNKAICDIKDLGV